MKKISEINQHLSKFNTKLVLYTYDSVLFDFDFNDGKKCINTIKKILEADGYVVRKYVGQNYGNLQEI